MARGPRREVAALPGVLGEIGLPFPITVNIIPPDRQAGRGDAGRAGWGGGAEGVGLSEGDLLKHIH